MVALAHPYRVSTDSFIRETIADTSECQQIYLILTPEAFQPIYITFTVWLTSAEEEG